MGIPIFSVFDMHYLQGPNISDISLCINVPGSRHLIIRYTTVFYQFKMLSVQLNWGILPSTKNFCVLPEQFFHRDLRSSSSFGGRREQWTWDYYMKIYRWDLSLKSCLRGWEHLVVIVGIPVGHWLFAHWFIHFFLFCTPIDSLDLFFLLRIGCYSFRWGRGICCTKKITISAYLLSTI